MYNKLTFKQFLTENTLNEAINSHMEHLEDSVLNAGDQGIRDIISFLRNTYDTLGGTTNDKIDVSLKVDGAPSIIAGIDPEDGQFFVAKKSIFNKNPKVYKSMEDVDEDIAPGDLNKKMKIALQYLPEIGITGILQGDFLFTHDDLTIELIKGEKYVVFQPNTIVYAVPVNTEFAKHVMSVKLGIVWHTVYVGDSLSDLSAKFNQNIADHLKQSKNVWFIDAIVRDVSGKATFTNTETKYLADLLQTIIRNYKKIDQEFLEKLSSDQKLTMRVKAYINSTIRMANKSTNSKQFYQAMVNYFDAWFDGEIGKKGSENGKATVRNLKRLTMNFLEESAEDFVAMFIIYFSTQKAKKLLLNKFKEISSLNTFLRTKNGFRVTNHEGFVVSDRLSGNAIKLVDRLEFSYANFSADVIKGFQR